jgi:hypothetical protein
MTTDSLSNTIQFLTHAKYRRSDTSPVAAQCLNRGRNVKGFNLGQTADGAQFETGTSRTNVDY